MKQINKDSIKLSLLISLLVISTLSGTYAFLNYDANANTPQGTGGCFQVNYSGAVISDLSTKTIQSNETGEETNLADDAIPNANSTVTLSKSSTCKIYTEANIYIHTNDETTAPIEGIHAFKYKITQGTNTIETGTINKKGDFLLTTVPITDTALTYNIYLWIDSTISGGAYNYTTFSGNIFAESAQTSTIENSYLINFNATGSDLLPEKLVTLNQNYGTLPIPSKTGYTFKGWNGKNKFDESKYTKLSDYNISDSSYKGAKIQLKPNTNYKVSIKRYNGFDGKNNGYLLISPSSTINDRWTSIAHNSSPNGALTNFLYTTDSDGLLYIGYYGINQTQMNTIWENTDVQIEEGSTSTTYEPYYVTNTTPVTQEKNHTLTAIWEPNTYTVTFDPNGGTVSPTSKTVAYGEKYDTLPIPTKSGYTFKGWSELPADYQQLEYIESTSTQYILTNIIPTSTTGVYAKLSSNNITNDLIYFGSKGTSNSRFWIGNNNSRLYYGWNTNTYLSTNIQTNEINIIKMNYLNDKKEIYNNTLAGNISSNLATDNTYPIAIFAGNAAGTINYKSSIKLYDLKISQGSNITADFIPCYKISTKKAGLYDKINDVFYSNANTSGDDFTKGDRKYITNNSPVTQSTNHTLTAIWEQN